MNYLFNRRRGMKMKKILATLFLAIMFQGVAETVVKGTYDTKKKDTRN